MHHPGFVDDDIFLFDPGRTFPLVDFTLDHFTYRSSSSHSSSDHSSSGHSISSHSLPGHLPPDTTVVDSSTPPRFVYPSLAKTPRCSEAYLRWRSAPLSTMYPSTTSESSAGDSSSEPSARPSRKRCRYSVATLTSSIHATRDIETDATAVEVVVDRDVVTRIDACIDIEVDVGVDVEDEVKDKVESSDRGTMEVGVDMAVGIDIPDGMLMPDVVERLEQVEKGLQDIYEHVMEIPLQRIEDIETGQRELESRSLIVSGDRASLLEQDAAFAMSWRELMKLMAEVYCPRNEIQKIESELWNLTVKNNDLANYTQRFQELTMVCIKMVPEEEDRVEKFIGGLPDNIQGNVILAEPTRLQDVVRIVNNLMDQKLKGYALKNAENKS
ncbi:reverse transcriptase domain-containing protein [Tanacetum coccineum]